MTTMRVFIVALLHSLPSLAQQQLTVDLRDNKKICYEYWNDAWDNVYNTCLSRPSTNSADHKTECTAEAWEYYNSLGMRQKEVNEQIREVPCPSAPLPTPRPNIASATPENIAPKSIACATRATKKAEDCATAAEQTASRSCDPDKDSGLQQARQEGDQVGSSLSGAENYNQVCRTNTGYNGKLKQAYQNFSQSCQSALTACRASCQDAQMEIDSCAGGSLQNLKARVVDAAGKCSATGTAARIAQEADAQATNSQNNQDIASNCAQASSAGGAGSGGANKQTVSSPTTASAPTAASAGAAKTTPASAGHEPTSFSKNSAGRNSDAPLVADVRAAPLPPNDAQTLNLGDGTAAEESVLQAAGTRQNFDKTPMPDLPEVSKLEETTNRRTTAVFDGIARGSGRRSTSASAPARSSRGTAGSQDVSSRQPAADVDPNLRRFLPKMSGDKDGHQGVAGMNNPHKDLFEAVTDRYQAVAASLFQD